MTTPAARTRLALDRLDDRVVPSTVTSTTSARPLDFTAAGTLTTTDPVAGGTPVATTNTVTVTGQLLYSSNTAGTSGTVTVAGSGSGDGLAVPLPPPPGSSPSATIKTTSVSFAQVLQAELEFEDAGGTVNVTQPLAGGAVYYTPSNGSGNRPLGPLDGAGSFDVADYSLHADFTGTGGTTAELTVTLADTTITPTDLAFETSSAAKASDNTIGADFTVGVTGKMMSAASHTAASARVTAVWSDGAGRTQAADLDVPLYWNTGRVVVSARGLTAPTWATTLTVKLDAAGAVAEADEANNSWTVNLSALATSPPPVDPTVPPPSVPPPPVSPPPPPVVGPPSTDPAGFSVSPGIGKSFVDWRDDTGRVLRTAVAFDGFEGEVWVAVGDVNGDDVLDVALAAGKGGGPRVRVLDGATGAELANVIAYEDDFRGGVNVAVGDLDGDGRDELIVGTGEGGGPRVRVFDGVGGMLRYEFMAYEESARGGVTVAAADLDGDGTAEVITGSGVGGGPVLAVFAGPTGAELQRVLAGSEDDRGGARVRAVKDDAAGYFIVTGESDETGALKRFRQQLVPGEGYLIDMMDPPVYPTDVFGGIV